MAFSLYVCSNETTTLKFVHKYIFLFLIYDFYLQSSLLRIIIFLVIVSGLNNSKYINKDENILKLFCYNLM